MVAIAFRMCGHLTVVAVLKIIGYIFLTKNISNHSRVAEYLYQDYSCVKCVENYRWWANGILIVNVNRPQSGQLIYLYKARDVYSTKSSQISWEWSTYRLWLNVLIHPCKCKVVTQPRVFICRCAVPISGLATNCPGDVLHRKRLPL